MATPSYTYNKSSLSPEPNNSTASVPPLSEATSTSTLGPSVDPTTRPSSANSPNESYRQGSSSLPPNNSSYSTDSRTTNMSTDPGTSPVPGPSAGPSSNGINTSNSIANSAANSHKRAYRQRRKDPSCDACRERKVKCDATETTSCSECSSRSVKCQFTKETNRRMSSIKQVQDLEKQMDRIRRENLSLRKMLQEREGSFERGDGDVDESDRLYGRLPEAGVDPLKKYRPATMAAMTAPSYPHGMPGFENARSQVRLACTGLFKLPPHAGDISCAIIGAFDPRVPELPSHRMTQHLLYHYYNSVHTMFPILHWTSFRENVDRMYARGSGRGESPDFLAAFFGVLAVGSLATPDPPPIHYSHRVYHQGELLEAARKLVDPWATTGSLDHVRALALITIGLNEINLKSGAFMWLGAAIRAAQSLGLYADTGPGCMGLLELEMRRRVWWTLYVLDRSLSTELGRPMIIDDSDCDIPLPAGVDDHYLSEDGPRVPTNAQPLSHSFLAVIHVMRSYGPLLRTLSVPFVTPAKIALLDQHFTLALRNFPVGCEPTSNEPLNPEFLSPLAYLLTARMTLHRHNLGPSAPSHARRTAVEQCISDALETSNLIARCTASLESAATALLTVHITRCALFLILGGYFEQAVICVRALRTFHAWRDVAAPCSRFLAFFVSAFIGKRSELASQAHYSQNPSFGSITGPRWPRIESIAMDEEMLVYVSADLQASIDHGWLWSTGSPVTCAIPIDPNDPSAPPQAGPIAAKRAAPFSLEARTGLSEEEACDWRRWERLEAAILNLVTPEMPPLSLPSQWSHSQTVVTGPSIKVDAGTPSNSSLPHPSTSGPQSGAPSVGDGIMTMRPSGNPPVMAQPNQAPPSLPPPQNSNALPLPSQAGLSNASKDRLSIANII